jgi:hypothetical protein
MRQRHLQVADRADVAYGGERLALAPPDHGSHVAPLRELIEDVEELDVHVVVERVVLFLVVVGDRGDRAVDVEPYRACHRPCNLGCEP